MTSRVARSAVRTFALAVSAAASACLHLGGTLPPRELYRLVAPDSVQLTTELAARGGAWALAPGAVAIAPYETPGVYGDPNIPYRVSETGYGVYPSREWAMPVSVMLGQLTERVFRARPLSASEAVYSPPSYRTYPYVWRASVRELDEIDRDSSVYAGVTIAARLVRTADDSVVWTGTARREAPVTTPTMDRIVATLSDLAAATIAQLGDDARAALTHQPGAPAPR